MASHRKRTFSVLKLSDVRKIVKELVNPIVERVPIVLTKHFRTRQRERHVDLFDVELVLRKGRVVREYQPDADHPERRWSMKYKNVTLVFNFNEDLKAVLLITCWRKNS